jgi:hypothetical protein
VLSHIEKNRFCHLGCRVYRAVGEVSEAPVQAMVVIHFILKGLPRVDRVMNGWNPNPKDIINKAYIKIYRIIVFIAAVVFVGGEEEGSNGWRGRSTHSHTVDLVPVCITEGELVVAKDDRQDIKDCLAR